MIPLLSVARTPVWQAYDPVVDILNLVDADTWGELAGRFVGPAILIVVILVVAALAIKVGKGAIRRSVERVAAGQPGWLQKLEDHPRPNSPMSDSILQVRRERRATALAALATSVLTVVVWAVAVMMILDQVGIALAPMLASAGIVGIALGFGAQDLVKDFLSGVFILAEDQYGLGDSVDVGDAGGVVEGVTLRSTRLRDVNGTLWHIPNGEIRLVGNQSQGWARSLLDIEIAYGADVDAAARTILEVAGGMAEEDPWSANFLEPPEMWGVERVSADAVTLRLVIKVLPGEQWRISRELRRRIMVALEAAGVDSPLALRTMWMRDAPGRESPPA